MTSLLKNGTLLGSDINVPEVSQSFSDLLKIPSVAKAYIEHDTADILTISTEWTFVDVVHKEKSSIVKNYTILKSSLKLDRFEPELHVYESTPVPINNVKLSSTAPSGRMKAVVTKGPSTDRKTGEDSGEILQIYENGSLKITFQLKEIGRHDGLYASDAWGCTMAWSPNEMKLAYLAERKCPRPKSFSSCLQGTGSTGLEIDTMGDEYAFKQSWGEQLRDAYQSVIVILDLAIGEFTLLPVPEKVFPSDLQWANDTSIIGTGYLLNEWRLGLIYCSNRESRIFQIGADGSNFMYLSKPGRSARSPRIHPGSDFVIWQERTVGGPHQKSREIMGLDLTRGDGPKTIYPINPPSKVPTYLDFPNNCYTQDGSRFVAVTPNEIDSVLLVFSAGQASVWSVEAVIREVNAVLWIGNEYIVASRDSFIEPSSLVLIDIVTKKVIPLTTPERVISHEIQRLVIPGITSPASFYYGPSGCEVKPNTVPLVVMPHGGPHTVFSDAFTPELALFLKLGYGVLRINYIGSLGGTTDVTESLCGKIGEADLKDCQNSVVSLLNQEKSIDRNRIVIHGGSHGGFLGAHLSSTFPEFYKAVALRNPVTNVLANLAVSDITDWQYVEGGLEYDVNSVLPFASDLKIAEKLMKCSPIHKAGKVLAATLFLLGSEDVRVPMSQGLAYYRTLITAGKTAEIRVYDDCHPLMKVPCRFDAAISSVLWFGKHLRKVNC